MSEQESQSSLENGEQNIETQRSEKTLLQKLHFKSHPDDLKQIKLEADRARAQLDNICRIVRDEANRLNLQKRSQLYDFIHLRHDPVQIVQVLIDQYRQSLEEKENAKKMYQNLEREKSNLQREFKENEREIRKIYESELNETKSQHGTEIRMYRDTIYQLQVEKQNLETTHKDQMRKQQEEKDAEKQRLISRMSEMGRSFETDREQIKRESKAQKAKMEHDHAQAKSQLKAEFDMKTSQLQKAREAEAGSLRKDIESLNGALLARERFKPATDNELEARFLDLAHDVGSLARLEWKSNRTDWTDELLGRFSKNQRLLKKQILQDSLWVVLHETIFCSPFRVLGEEGRSLEVHWTMIFGQDSQSENGDYKWPKPSLDAERWRYDTVKQCQAVLKHPTSESDPRARLKKGFKTAKGQIREGLMATLGEIANLDQSTLQALENLITKAVNMWFEFSTQRCRILVSMPGSNLSSQPDRAKKAREGSLKLTLVPGLRRHGNSKGQNLELEETVGGCEGDTVKISMKP